MSETFSCEANVIKKDNNYKIEYYLVTEDESNFGIKSIMYENNSLVSTNLFDLDLSRIGAEQMIIMFCTNYVFPKSYFDILTDMVIDTNIGIDIENDAVDNNVDNNIVKFPVKNRI